MSTAPPSPPGAPVEPESGRDFDVFRLRLGDVVGLLAAFALLFILAGDWYSTSTGVQAREIVERQGTEGPGSGLFDDGAVEDARIEAEQAERNAWQVSSPLALRDERPDGTLDRPATGRPGARGEGYAAERGPDRAYNPAL